jgi:hypothetical protein
MTILRIEVNEYECLLCGYKWINRVNGKDGPIPERCAKCKKYGWNGQRKDAMTPEESGLRIRIKNLYKLYRLAVWRVSTPHIPLSHINEFSMDDYLNPEVVARFLNLDNPRPTKLELLQALQPKGLALRLNSQNLHRLEAYYPDPEKPGWLKHDKPPYENYLKWLKYDTQKQQQAMQQIIEKHEQEQKRKKPLEKNSDGGVELKP